MRILVNRKLVNAVEIFVNGISVNDTGIIRKWIFPVKYQMMIFS